MNEQLNAVLVGSVSLVPDEVEIFCRSFAILREMALWAMFYLFAFQCVILLFHGTVVPLKQEK